MHTFDHLGGLPLNPRTLYISTPTLKDDASNRRWLSGAPEGAGQSSNWAEREVLAQRERLSGVEGTIMRCVSFERMACGMIVGCVDLVPVPDCGGCKWATCVYVCMTQMHRTRWMLM